MIMFLRNTELFQPIAMTKVMEEEEFSRYVRIRDNQVGPTCDKLMKYIKDDFYGSHRAYIPKEGLDYVWSFVMKRLRENEALARFTLDYEGAISDFFFPWLATVATSPSAALEMSYGFGYNLEGEWKNCGVEDDEIDFFVRNDPTFVYNRERQLYVADLATSVKEAVATDKKAKIVDYGAGRMAWARRHGFRFEPDKLSILAFDRDPTINPADLFGRKWPKTGIEYRQGDFINELRNPECMDANMIILGGVASYYPSEMFKDVILKSVYNLLQKGGIFFFDLQLDCPYYRRSVKVFDWPEMKLAKSADVAISVVEETRKLLWKEGRKFSAEYALDTYNEYPTSVMVVLTKE